MPVILIDDEVGTPHQEGLAMGTCRGQDDLAVEMRAKKVHSLQVGGALPLTAVTYHSSREVHGYLEESNRAVWH
jgi:hypothetical protein